MQQENDIQKELESINSKLGNISRKMPFDVPDNYFSNLPAQIMASVREKDITLPLSKENPFAAPQGYFEQLPMQILSAVKEKQKTGAKVIVLPKNIRIAAAAILLLLAGAGVFKVAMQQNSFEHQSGLKTVQIAILTDIAENFPRKTIGYAAENILSFYDVMNRPLCADFLHIAERIAPKALRTSKAVKALTVYPNPAKEQAVFSYNLSGVNDRLSLIITNVGGTTIKTFHLQGKQGVQHWYIGDIPNGVYFYQLRDSKRKYATGKVAIMK